MTIAGLEKSDLINYPDCVAATVFVRGCNMHCPYCHNPSLANGSAADFVSEDEVLSFLKKRSRFLDAFVISGGEPVLQDDLVGFIGKVRSMGLKVKLDTNGSRPDVVNVLLANGLLDYVALDVKAAPDRYFPLFSDDPDSGHRVIETVSILGSSKITHEYRTTCPKKIVTETDFDAISDIVSFDKSAVWYLQTFSPRVTLDPSLAETDSYSHAELSAVASRLAASKGMRAEVR